MKSNGVVMKMSVAIIIIHPVSTKGKTMAVILKMTEEGDGNIISNVVILNNESNSNNIIEK
jgi:hypothetical protein